MMQRVGESYSSIIRLWIPELISATLLFTLPILLDSFLIAQLDSRTMYGALGVANNLLHVLTKLAEAISIATIATIGKYNGSQEYEKAGKSLGDAFWTTIIMGMIPAVILFFFSKQIYLLLNVPNNMAIIGSPFLKLRAIGVFLSFIYLSFFGFMRGIKNTRTPMNIYIAGIIAFVVFDYILILGCCGFPQMGLLGSAIATIVQYAIMVILGIIHILYTKEYRKYFPQAFYRFFSKEGSSKIVRLSIPIMIDKVSLAYAYVYLNSQINPLGKNAIASFNLIKDLERLAFLPGIAFATVLTFLVSNAIGAGDVDGARSTIRRVLILTALGVGMVIAFLCIDPGYVMSWFDRRELFSPFAAKVFPFISLLVVFDFAQLIFASALRGAGDVYSVMIIRFLACTAFFYPLSFFISSLSISNEMIRFIATYSAVYITTGVMGFFFYLRLRGKKWYTK